MRLEALGPEAVNALANASGVREALGGVGPIDVGAVLAGGGAAWGDHAATPRLAFLFAPHAPGLYSAHTITARGEVAYGRVLASARAALDLAFSALPAVEVWTQCGTGGQEAMAKALGFRPLARGPHWRLTWPDWAVRSKAAGRLGAALHEAFEAAGAAHHQDGDSAMHHALVGGALLGGLAAVRHAPPALLLASRSVMQYNRLAAVMGYEPVSPPTAIGLALSIDVGSGLRISICAVDGEPLWSVEPAQCQSASSVQG